MLEATQQLCPVQVLVLGVEGSACWGWRVVPAMLCCCRLDLGAAQRGTSAFGIWNA